MLELLDAPVLLFLVASAEDWSAPEQHNTPTAGPGSPTSQGDGSSNERKQARPIVGVMLAMQCQLICQSPADSARHAPTTVITVIQRERGPAHSEDAAEVCSLEHRLLFTTHQATELAPSQAIARCPGSGTTCFRQEGKIPTSPASQPRPGSSLSARKEGTTYRCIRTTGPSIWRAIRASMGMLSPGVAQPSWKQGASGQW
jgi:hypothetical protein